MSENKELLKIGEASKFLGVSKRTLLNWEEKGLISPIVLPSGHRRYRIEVLKEILENGKKSDKRRIEKDC